MINRTGKEIEGYVWKQLRDSTLAKALSGRVYRDGTRPRGSVEEDAVVIFSGGRSDEISEGFVTINIYVPDVAPWDNGVYVEDVERTEELGRLAGRWVSDLPVYPYRFSLRDTIYTMEDRELRQHFIAVHLMYRIYEPRI